MEKIILDTNILIEILKNNKEIIKKVEKYNILYISEVTKMELFYEASITIKYNIKLFSYEDKIRYNII